MEVNNSKTCGCKGVRTCLVCEEQRNIPQKAEKSQVVAIYNYCATCGGCWSNHQDADSHEKHTFKLDGIVVVPDFIGEEEELETARRIDKIPWMPSQSGRRKQDFGPKVNFKKRKVKIGNFGGFPDFAATIARRLAEVDQLSMFQPVELCHLEYVPERGSAIEPHLDDSWLWGEHLVTLNLLSEAFLILTPTDIKPAKNCGCHEAFRLPYEHNPSLSSIMAVEQDPTGRGTPACRIESIDQDTVPNVEVRILMPRRSLLVLFGCARHHWYHEIRRDGVINRRLAMTFRELSDNFVDGGPEMDVGKELLKIAQQIVDA